jgi:FG-GAP-like repeat/FG-GAP repeat/Dockerin type I domain
MANVIRVSIRDLGISALIFCFALAPTTSVYSAPAPAFSYAESAGDWLGEHIANAGDVNGDGVSDIIVGARKHGGTLGLATVLSGVDGSVLYRYQGFSGANLGHSVSGIGDINADGFDDFAIGEFSMPFGKIYVRSGIDGAVLLTIEGGNYGTMGKSVAGVGDVNGDTVPDIGIGVNGVVRVHSGADGSLIYTLYADVTGWSGFGDKLAGAGDVNADGYDDIIVGAMYQSENPDCFASGKTYVFSGIDGSLIYSYAGESCQSYVGTAVAGVGDVNEDGYADFAVAKSYGVKVYSGITGLILYTLNQHGSSLWMSVSSIGDIDGDGIADIVAAVHKGKFVVYSGATGLRIAWSPALDPGNMFGVRVVGASDIDGDGIPDVTLSDYQNDMNGEDAGILYGLPLTPGVDCCYKRGDFVADGRIFISDVTAAVARIFSGGEDTACPEDADANGDGAFNISDVTALIAYIFTWQQPLAQCP